MDLKDFEKIDFVYKANLDFNGIVYTSKKDFKTYQEAWRFCIENSPKNEFCEFFVSQIPNLEIVQPFDEPEKTLKEFKNEIKEKMNAKS